MTDTIPKPRVMLRCASRGISKAARVLRQGGIVAYATEAVYGLGCDPRNRDAVIRLLRLKQRSVRKGLILIAAAPGQLDPYVAELPARARKTWPGPHTWLVKPSANAPRWITGHHDRIAVRVTAHPQAAALCRLADMAIVSTSANTSGHRPVRSYREAVRRFGGKIDYVLRGRVGDRRRPTPIADAVSGKVVRCA
jgi:L-threonylcarbamoyladenylate synthase